MIVNHFFISCFPWQTLFVALIMSTCVSSDVSVFSTNQMSIATCLGAISDSNSPTAVFPSGTLVQTCMSNAGISTGCSQCWANTFDSIKTCLVDTCGISMGQGPPTTGEPSQACISCLMSMSTQFAPSGSSDTIVICGINPESMGEVTEGVRNQLSGLMINRDDGTTPVVTTTSGKSAATIARRGTSFATTIIVGLFLSALIM